MRKSGKQLTHPGHMKRERGKETRRQAQERRVIPPKQQTSRRWEGAGSEKDAAQRKTDLHLSTALRNFRTPRSQKSLQASEMERNLSHKGSRIGTAASFSTATLTKTVENKDDFQLSQTGRIQGKKDTL